MEFESAAFVGNDDDFARLFSDRGQHAGPSMTPHRDEDEDEEDWDDAEADAGDDPDDGDEEPTVPCPYCRCEMLEDSPHCPACGRYISAEDQPSSGKPLWIIATALICLGIAIWSVFAAF